MLLFIFLENPLYLSWHDSARIPHLNPQNILDYFSDRSNPFYDNTCNNEIIKMQKSDMNQIKMMTGVEYSLLHVQEPILYVISKQHRHSPSSVTPLAHYYILAGYVYQAPDLQSVINSRMQTALFNLSSAFTEAHSYMSYHPTKGYSWEFKDSTGDVKKDKEKEKAKEKIKEDQTYSIQRRRMDMLLADLTRKFPPKINNPPPQVAPNDQAKPDEASKNEPKIENVQTAGKRSADASVTGPPAKVRPTSETNRN